MKIKYQFLAKMEILVKNQCFVKTGNFSQTLMFFVKTGNFGQKSIFVSKLILLVKIKFLAKLETLVKNQIFCQNWKYWSNSEIFCQN